MVEKDEEPQGAALDRALWNLSIIIGRTYKETRDAYEYLEQNRQHKYNNGLFRIIHALGQRIIDEQQDRAERLTIFFTPSLQEVLGQHRYATAWAESLSTSLVKLKLHERPIHIISANLHSIKNIFFGKGALLALGKTVPDDLYDMVHLIREENIDVAEFAQKRGFYTSLDESGCNVDVQIIDTVQLTPDCIHPEVRVDFDLLSKKSPVIIVLDYAFGAQAYEILDEFLSPTKLEDGMVSLQIESISIMGKAGILPGEKGDIMLATAHVMEGTPHNYIVENDLSVDDFEGKAKVYSGPMVTVLGTSLQNRDVLDRFYNSPWKAIGLEMEGGHYQRAINAAIIQGHIPKNMKVRYAYYASDNPLLSGQTLASGPMGVEGVAPTYLISKIIIEKICNPDEA